MSKRLNKNVEKIEKNNEITLPKSIYENKIINKDSKAELGSCHCRRVWAGQSDHKV